MKYLAASCPRLVKPEHGTIQPPHCIVENVLPGERCILHCEPGFLPLGKRTAVCSANQTWSPSDDLRCVQIVKEKLAAPLKPVITCPDDISVVLAQGHTSALVKINKPKTNVDWQQYVDAQPAWAKQLQADLSPGVHSITFRARSPNSHLFQTCQMLITVEGKILLKINV